MPRRFAELGGGGGGTGLVYIAGTISRGSCGTIREVTENIFF